MPPSLGAAACAFNTQSFVLDAADLHVDRLVECFALDEHAPALEQRSSRYLGRRRWAD
jgi:hypothetical protein